MKPTRKLRPDKQEPIQYVKIRISEIDLFCLCNGEITDSIIKAARDRLALGSCYKD